ncbi:MAG: hypothetical protein A2015_14020 [Spirochaetes bacterium GWF1_31_7]|nr:MAG: hypothetical protein A2Y30_03730 [Spirochaetes bacterium GWE1_32_154]OHD48126.1 MAG: hypothetical protein A2Y29_10835 [Spirochaetes bacterium GWE2_31_10]OHD50519.1 MAG: hypothetical protein A2015_14020 [Spirochaetes bacterium GWF1_31_7]OHD81334.1 MAG: hypothetical protein A2355_10920 [Spirochaetes bacterium RIFOXYB1_FULL_32_8]HBD94168.1 hypothetical protein [Spirochaetia bacterium]
MNRSVVTLFLLILLVSCFKEKNNTIKEQPLHVEPEIVAGDEINFVNLQDIVKNAPKLTPEVFFAITVLHRKYIESLEKTITPETAGNPEALFEQKRVEFFKNIKFGYEEYMSYYENNQKEMNDYIMKNPQLMKYLTITK